MSLKSGVSHICASAESFTTNINDFNCRDKNRYINKRAGMKTRRERQIVTKVMSLSYKKRETLP